MEPTVQCSNDSTTITTTITILFTLPLRPIQTATTTIELIQPATQPTQSRANLPQFHHKPVPTPGTWQNASTSAKRKTLSTRTVRKVARARPTASLSRTIRVFQLPKPPEPRATLAVKSGSPSRV
ncbi:hypothetical protein BD777DRAFT_15274 [Yarrowia lipolytica]|nr:hypothetical protein BD777DRAFT_15274 [Yarrowia lipolytica]